MGAQLRAPVIDAVRRPCRRLWPRPAEFDRSANRETRLDAPRSPPMKDWRPHHQPMSSSTRPVASSSPRARRASPSSRTDIARANASNVSRSVIPNRLRLRAPSCSRWRLQARSMWTSWAWAASAPRSDGSDVRTEPPGSAHATTSASIADPRRACERRAAARRARRSGTSSTTSQVLRSRFTKASRAASPRSDSISTGVGTSGGHRPSVRSASRSAAAEVDRSASRETPPESRTSTSAGDLIGSPDQPPGDCPGPGCLLGCGLPHLIEELAQVLIGRLDELSASQLDADCCLQELRRSESTFFDRPIEIIGKVDLHPWHTPKHTHCPRRMEPSSESSGDGGSQA